MTDPSSQPKTDSRKEEDKGHSHFVQRKKDTYVFVLCKCGKPLMPTTSPKARILLKHGKARVFRLYPFTIQLNYEVQHNTQPVEIRIDYGAKTHGIALVQQCRTHDRAVFLGEAAQRQNVKKNIDIRRILRKERRLRNTRYRKRRCHRGIPRGWVPPTIRQRVETVIRITRSLCKVSPITSAVAEIGMFDTQKIANSIMESREYQQGPGYGFENKREATLAYFNHSCQYCGFRKGDLIRTAQGLAYIDSIKTSGKLQYRCISGERHSARPNRVRLVESVKSIQFFVNC